MENSCHQNNSVNQTLIKTKYYPHNIAAVFFPQTRIWTIHWNVNSLKTKLMITICIMVCLIVFLFCCTSPLHWIIFFYFKFPHLSTWFHDYLSTPAARAPKWPLNLMFVAINQPHLTTKNSGLHWWLWNKSYGESFAHFLESTKSGGKNGSFIVSENKLLKRNEKKQ